MTLEGRVALVTGGSRGIGRAIVKALAEAGAKVAFVYRSNKEAADSLVEELKEAGREDVLAIQADVSVLEDVQKTIDQVLGQWERLDILVNNAGIIRDGLLLTMTDEQWREVIETNLNSVFYFCRAAAKQMISQRHGRIINMSSVSAHLGNPGQCNYAASKGGIEAFTRCLAAELAKRGVTVNAIAPGFVETDMTEKVRDLAGDKLVKKIPTKRFGKPEDIAHAVLFLASDEASYVTGQVLTVDGGLTLGGL